MIDSRISQLAKAGMIFPYSKACVQPCSYDLHLGLNAKIEARVGFKSLDLSRYSKERPYYMRPGDFILAETAETIRLPDNVEAHLHLVSSRARQGLNHLLSGLVDTGYQGVLTLELQNVLRYNKVGIYPNQRIAQLTFWEYSENSDHPYRGRYFGDTEVSEAKTNESKLLRPSWGKNLRGRLSGWAGSLFLHNPR